MPKHSRLKTEMFAAGHRKLPGPVAVVKFGVPIHIVKRVEGVLHLVHKNPGEAHVRGIVNQRITHAGTDWPVTVRKAGSTNSAGKFKTGTPTTVAVDCRGNPKNYVVLGIHHP